MFLKWIGWFLLAVIVIGTGVYVLFNRNFFKESYQELKKVTWPTKDHALNSAIITVAFIVTFSLVLAFIDYLINLLVVGLVG